MDESYSPYTHFFKVDDVVDIKFMAEDLYFLMGQTRDDSPRKFRADHLHPSPFDRLNVVAFKAITQTINNLLMQTVDFNAEKKTNDTKLFLNQNGELHREPKTKYCYEIGEGSDRYKIVKFLASSGYKQTQVIADELGNKNIQTLRTEIGKINLNVKNKLGLSDFIDGKKGSGYRLNPKYKVALKNE